MVHDPHHRCHGVGIRSAHKVKFAADCASMGAVGRSMPSHRSPLPCKRAASNAAEQLRTSSKYHMRQLCPPRVGLADRGSDCATARVDD
eukprot:331440-Chlamydomonas_euryale.AAC.1